VCGYAYSKGFNSCLIRKRMETVLLFVVSDPRASDSQGNMFSSLDTELTSKSHAENISMQVCATTQDYGRRYSHFHRWLTSALHCKSDVPIWHLVLPNHSRNRRQYNHADERTLECTITLCTHIQSQCMNMFI